MCYPAQRRRRKERTIKTINVKGKLYPKKKMNKTPKYTHIYTHTRWKETEWGGMGHVVVSFFLGNNNKLI